MLRRRHSLSSMVTLAAPSVARSQDSRVLRFVPRTGVALLETRPTAIGFLQRRYRRAFGTFGRG
jgi:hypothetical protein